MSLSKSSTIKIGVAALGIAALGYGVYKLLGQKVLKFTQFDDAQHDKLFELKKVEAMRRSSIVSNVEYKLALAFLPRSEIYEGYVEIFYELSEKMPDLFIDFTGETCLWIKINGEKMDPSLSLFDSHRI